MLKSVCYIICGSAMPIKLNLLVVRGDAGVQAGATQGLAPVTSRAITPFTSLLVRSRFNFPGPVSFGRSASS